MRVIYKRSLTLIGLLIMFVVFIGVAYLFYDRVLVSDTKVVVDNELSMNYIDGNKITKNGVYQFSVSNNGANDVYYNIIVNNLKNYDSKITYNLVSRESKINIEDEAFSDHTEILLNSVLIKAGATENFTLTIKNNEFTSFNIEVKKTNDIEEYFYTTIIKNNEVKEKSVTKIGDVSTINEGLIEDIEDEGATYYFRGNVDNNYVSFAGLTWRIVRINGNGTVRIILNTISNDLTSYHSSNIGDKKFQDTSIYQSLNSYYEENLKEYDSYINSAKYCIENEKIDDTGEYNSYARVVTNNIPTFNCLGEKITNKIGLITVDEVIYAGGSFDQDNKSYYLYNDKITNYWWTSNLGKLSKNDYYPFSVQSSGKVNTGISGTLNRGLRPVINLNKELKVTGTGTIDNPYIINIEQ